MPMQFMGGLDIQEDNVFNTFNVCKLNSRVGERMTAAADMIDVEETLLVSCDLRRCELRYFSKRGIQNAAVFPDPVLAMTTVSLPDRTSGRDFLWTGVGVCEHIYCHKSMRYG
jgi:hypothetical protein